MLVIGTQLNRVSDFRDFVCSFFSQRQSFLLLFYSTVAGVVLCSGRKISTNRKILFLETYFFSHFIFYRQFIKK